MSRRKIYISILALVIIMTTIHLFFRWHSIHHTSTDANFMTPQDHILHQHHTKQSMEQTYHDDLGNQGSHGQGSHGQGSHGQGSHQSGNVHDQLHGSLVHGDRMVQYATKESESRAEAVKNAFLHAWNGYKNNAWGKDDLKPLTGKFHNWVKDGVAMTMVDGLDTAKIMGLEKEVEEAVDWIRKNLNFHRPSFISTFECTIRMLGGLLSAYDLIGDEVLLEKAKDLGDRLLRAFSSSTGIPFGMIHLSTGNHMPIGWAKGGAVLSEFMTVQVEFKRLSKLTADPKYQQAVDRVTDVIRSHERPDGLYPTFFSLQGNHFTNQHISFGAWGDSAYEYFIKQYLLTSKTESKFLDMYKKSMDGMFSKMVKRSKPSNYLYIKELNGPYGSEKMDHLVCFAGGMLLLGSDYTGNKERDRRAGLDLVETCYQSYKQSASGLGPETIIFKPDHDFSPGVKTYLLRPETVESIFYAWRYTHDQKYRDWGWEIFQSIERHCKTQYGYASIHDVTSAHPTKADEMHSFFLAETLKYLYLLFQEDDVISLNEWVFNTEAHPVKIWKP